MQLRQSVKQLSVFMRKHGLISSKTAVGCTHCNAFKAMRWQAQLLDAFAYIFIWLSDNGKIEELRLLKEFINAKKDKKFRRILLAYAGKATGNKERLIIVD